MPWKERIVHEAQKVGLIYHICGPMPWFFASETCDAGLLILSRYPIVASSFQKFRQVSQISDRTAIKGFLYAKIDLSVLGGTYLHLFNTHTQSTEFDCPTEVYVQTFVTRYEQIK